MNNMWWFLHKENSWSRMAALIIMSKSHLQTFYFPVSQTWALLVQRSQDEKKLPPLRNITIGPFNWMLRLPPVFWAPHATGPPGEKGVSVWWGFCLILQGEIGWCSMIGAKRIPGILLNDTRPAMEGGKRRGEQPYSRDCDITKAFPFSS